MIVLSDSRPSLHTAWFGSTLPSISVKLLSLIALATAVTYYYETHTGTWWSLSSLPFSLVGLALSIFLGFRNNACYDRWWEARKHWGALINTTRYMTRQIQTLLIAPGADKELNAFQVRYVHGIIAYVYALKDHLRRTNPDEDLTPYLGEEHVKSLHKYTNVPIAVAHILATWLAEARAKGWIDPFQVPHFDNTINRLTDIQGACERIKNTPVPFAYTALTHRIVGVYTIALPFGIVKDLEWATPFVVAIISFAFLALDAAGSQIEDPFELDPNDLPLDALARTIEIDLLERIDAESIPGKQLPDDGVLT